MLPFAATGHWVVLGSVVLSATVATLRWSPRLGGILRRLFGQIPGGGAGATGLAWANNLGWNLGGAAAGGVSAVITAFLLKFIKGGELLTGQLAGEQLFHAMISGIDSTLGLKLFHGAVVHTLGQLLSAQMQAAMGMDVNNARVVTMDAGMVALVAAGVSSACLLSGAASAAHGPAYTHLGGTLAHGLTWLTGAGGLAAKAATALSNYATVRRLIMPDDTFGGLDTTPWLGVGSSLLGLGFGVAYFGASAVLGQATRQTISRRLTRMAKLAGVAIPAVALGQLAGIVKPDAAKVGWQWAQLVLQSGALSIMLRNAYEGFEVVYGLWERSRQSANDRLLTMRGRAFDTSERALALAKDMLPPSLATWFSNNGGRVAVSATAVLAIYAVYDIYYFHYPAGLVGTVAAIAPRDTWNVYAQQLWANAFPGSEDADFGWMPLTVRAIKPAMEMAGGGGGGGGTTLAIGRQAALQLPPGFEDLLRDRESLKPKGRQQPISLDELVAQMLRSQNAHDALLDQALSIQLDRKSTPTVLAQLSPMDCDAQARLATESARLTMPLRPSPMLAAVLTPGFALRAFDAMHGLLRAVEPPVRLRAIECTTTEVAPVEASFKPPSGDWFDAWLGEEDARDAAGSTPSANEDAYVRVGGSRVGLDALRSGPRNLGDLLKPPVGARAPNQGEALDWPDVTSRSTDWKTLSDVDGVIGRLDKNEDAVAEAAETRALARLGFALIDADASGETQLIVNMLAKNLSLAAQRPSTVTNFLVYPYNWRQDAVKTVDFCRALVAECTMRLAYSAMATERRGSDVDDAADALAGVASKRLHSAIGTGSQPAPTLIELLARATWAAVNGYVRDAQASKEGDAKSRLRELHEELAAAATVTSSLAGSRPVAEYRLTLPRQVAQINAEIAHEADMLSDQGVVPQLPLLQTLEYAAIAALREDEGMAAGSDLRAEWIRLVRLCDALSPNGADEMGVLVARAETTVREPPISSVTLSSNSLTASEGRFDDLEKEPDREHVSDARTIVITELSNAASQAGHPNRATVVYLACRLAALAARTPGNGEDVTVRSVRVVKHDAVATTAHLAIGGVAANEDVYTAVGGEAAFPHHDDEKGPFAPVDLAKRIVASIHNHVLSTDRLAIVVALGPVRLAPVSVSVRAGTFPEKFEPSNETSVVTSIGRALDTLQVCMPGNDNWDERARKQRASVATALAAAGVFRDGEAGPDGTRAIARDVARVSTENLDKFKLMDIARNSADHREPAVVGMGYVDAGDAKAGRRMLVSSSTAHLKEAWGTFGVYSPESAHRAAEALQAAAVVSALQRQQPASTAVDKKKAATPGDADTVDDLLRTVLEKGEEATEKKGVGVMRASLELMRGGRLGVALREGRGLDGDGYKWMADTVGRALAATQLANAPKGRQHVAGMVASLFAIWSSPLGESDEGKILMFDLLTMYLGSGIAWQVMSKLGWFGSEMWARIQRRPLAQAGGNVAAQANRGMAHRLVLRVATVGGLALKSTAAAAGALLNNALLRQAATPALKDLPNHLASLSPLRQMQDECFKFYVGFYESLMEQHGQPVDGAVSMLQRAAEAVGLAILSRAFTAAIKAGAKAAFKDSGVIDADFLWREDDASEAVKVRPVAARPKAAEPSPPPPEEAASNEESDEEYESRLNQGYDPPKNSEREVLRQEQQAEEEEAKTNPAVPIPVYGSEQAKMLGKAAQDLGGKALNRPFDEDLLIEIRDYPRDASVGTSPSALDDFIEKIEELQLRLKVPEGHIMGSTTMPSYIKDLKDKDYAIAVGRYVFHDLLGRALKQSSPSEPLEVNDGEALALGAAYVAWVGALDGLASDDTERKEQVAAATEPLVSANTLVDSFLHGEMPDPTEDGTLRSAEGRATAERRAGMLASEGWKVNALRGVRECTIAALANTFVTRAYSAVVGTAQQEGVTDPIKSQAHLVLEGLRRAKTSAAAATVADSTFGAYLSYFTPGREAARNLAMRRREAGKLIKQTGLFSPGSTSWTVSFAGATLGVWHLLGEARVAFALRSSRYDVPHFARRIWQTNPVYWTTVVMALAAQLLAVYAGEQAPTLVQMGLSYLSQNPIAGIAWLADPNNGWRTLVTTILTLISSSTITSVYNGWVAPARKWLANPRMRTLIRESKTGKGLLPAPLSEDAEYGWLSRTTVPLNRQNAQQMDRTNPDAVLLTEYAVEIAALVAVGDLRDCSDPLDLGGESGRFVTSVRDRLWEGLKRDGAFVEGLPDEKADEFKERATRVIALARSVGAVPRLSSASVPTRRFTPIDDSTPRAFAAYAALFGVPDEGKTAAARPIVPLGHAVVSANGATVHVTDALRGAVAGGYDALAQEGWWKDQRVRLTTENFRAFDPTLGMADTFGYKPYAYTTMDALGTMVVQHLAACYTTSTLAEFALLCRAALRVGSTSSYAADAMLRPLKGAIDAVDDKLDSVPLCGLGVRREGLVEQGRLAVLWSWQVPKLPKALSALELREGAQRGMSDRYLRGKGATRGDIYDADVVVGMLRDAWVATRGWAGTAETAMEALQPACVRFGDDYDCRSFDDVVLESSEYDELRKQLVAGVELTKAVRAALRALPWRGGGVAALDGLERAVKAAKAKHYAVTVRLPRNALLPDSVLGRSDVTDDLKRQRCMGAA